MYYHKTTHFICNLNFPSMKLYFLNLFFFLTVYVCASKLKLKPNQGWTSIPVVKCLTLLEREPVRRQLAAKQPTFKSVIVRSIGKCSKLITKKNSLPLYSMKDVEIVSKDDRLIRKCTVQLRMLSFLPARAQFTVDTFECSK